MPLPYYIKVECGLLVDTKKHSITTPINKRITDQDAIPQSVKDQYNYFFSFPKGTIFKYRCSSLSHRYKTTRKKVIQSDPNDKNVFQESRQGVPVDCYMIYYQKHIFYIFDDRDGLTNSCDVHGSLLGHVSTDINHVDVESPTGLSTIYKISAFALLIKDFEFKGKDFIFDEVDNIFTLLLVRFRENEQYFNLPAETFSKKVQNAMHNYTLSTFSKYCSHFKYFYFYLLNLDAFLANPDLNIDPTLAEQSRFIRNGILLLDQYTDIDVLHLRILEIRSFVIKILEDEHAFSVIIKSCLITETFKVKTEQTCATVINSVKYFLKHLLIYTNNKVIPDEFRKAFIDENYTTLFNMQVVFNSIKSKGGSKSNHRVIRKNDVYYVDDKIISLGFCRKVYSSLLDLYDDYLSQLANCFVHLVSVETTYKELKFTFIQSSPNFFASFPATITSSLWKRCFINSEQAHKHLDEIICLFNKISACVVAMVFFSSGGLCRMYEITKINGVSTEKSAYIYRDGDFEYAYLSSTVNKNNSFARRYFFCDPQATKYFIHYMILVKQAFAVFVVDCKIGIDVSNRFDLIKRLQKDDDRIDEIYDVDEITGLDSLSFLRTYVFFGCVFLKDTYFVSKLDTENIRELLYQLCGTGFHASLWRQLFMYVSEEIGAIKYREVIDFINNVIYTNAGHLAVTHLNWYSRSDDSLQVERTGGFYVTFEIMKRTNSLLFGVTDSDVETDHHVPVSFSLSNIFRAVNMLYPEMELRLSQGMALRAIGLCLQNYVLQAPTGYGKTIIFTVMIKLFRIYYPEFVNVLLLPYATLREDMAERLGGIGFNVGHLKEIKPKMATEDLKDVYVGCFESIPSATLEVIPNKGLVVFDEAHTLHDEKSFRNVLNDLKTTGLNHFKKILLTSATLSMPVAQKIFEQVDIKTEMVYDNVIDKIPIDNFYCHSIDYKKYISQATGEFSDKAGILHKYLNQFSVNMMGYKGLVFFNNRDKLEEFDQYFLTVHGKMGADDKINRFNKFKQNVDILLGTKLLSNGLNIDSIKLVVFYDYIPDAVELIQAMGRIRKKGLVLFITDRHVCVQSILETYYNLKKPTHVNCCNSPVDEELSYLRDSIVFDNSNNMPDGVLPLNVKVLRNKVLQLYDRSVYDDFIIDSQRNKNIQLRIINDPLFLFCYKELATFHPYSSVHELQEIFVNFIAKADGPMDSEKFSFFVKRSNLVCEYLSVGFTSDESFINSLETCPSSISFFDDCTYFDKELVLGLQTLNPHMCSNCFMPYHGRCERNNVRYLLYSIFLKKYKNISNDQRLFSYFFITSHCIINGKPRVSFLL